MSLAAVFVAAAFSSAAAKQDTYCASQPPPQGLVERCRSKAIVVPDTEQAFRFLLTEWMRTCVSSDRAPALVYGADSVDYVWSLVQDRPRYQRTVTIYPEYEPLTFTQGGRTCYGVKSVEFRTTKRRTEVDSDDLDVTSVPVSTVITSDMIKDAAAAAQRAIANSPARDNPGLSEFRGVLDGLSRYGKDFDDRYYPVAPILGAGTSQLNSYSCDKDYSVSSGRYDCLPADEAVKACERHLADDIVTAVQFDKLSPQKLTDMLESKSADIQRGFAYVYQLQSFDSSGATACPALRDVIKPKMGELAQRGKTTVYGYY